jgi:hypothetical protein
MPSLQVVVQDPIEEAKEEKGKTNVSRPSLISMERSIFD